MKKRKRIIATSFRLIKLFHVSVKNALIDQDPTLTGLQSRLLKETICIFVVPQSVFVLTKRFINHASISQYRSAPLFIIQRLKGGQRLGKVTKCFIIGSQATTDLAQHELHPRFPFSINRFAENGQPFLRVLIGGPELALLTQQESQFIKHPPCCNVFMQRLRNFHATSQATFGFYILSLLAEDRSQATKHLTLTYLIANAYGMELRSPQHRQQFRRMTTTRQYP